MMDSEETDAEAKLLNILSLLAASDDEATNETDGGVSWLARQLAAPSSTTQETNDIWTSSLHEIASVILPSIEPRDLHSVAVQAIVFSDQDVPSSSIKYNSLCLLLCCHALRSCPPKPLNRWKRWRSLLCETIALYQQYILVAMDDNDNEQAAELWLQHVLPACQHVQCALPKEEEMNPIPTMAGMVSVTTRLVTIPLAPATLEGLLDSVMTLTFNNAETLLRHPWRIYEHKDYDDNDDNDDDDNHMNELWWWTIYADCDDRVAGMDTVWYPDGIALLSYLNFEHRPCVYSPNFQWFLWFPHTSTALLHRNMCDKYTLNVLQSLLQQMPSESLDWKEEEPSSPVGTLQLLMNRTMVPSSRDNNNNNNNKTRVVSCIKDLLSKYTPSSQVALISTLVETCPHPGMIPRLLDLLRPIVTHACVVDYLSKLLDKLLSKYLNKNGELCHVEELVDRVEEYVSVVSLLQLRIMTDSSGGISVDERLNALLEALTITLQQDDDDDDESHAHFRLNLLQHALHQVVSLLQE